MSYMGGLFFKTLFNTNTWQWKGIVKIIEKYVQHKQQLYLLNIYNYNRGRHGHDRMVVVFKTTYAVSAYHHSCFEFESC